MVNILTTDEAAYMFAGMNGFAKIIKIMVRAANFLGVFQSVS